MSKFRLALVRQKYRPDGGAERFVSRALEALDSSHLQPERHHPRMAGAGETGLADPYL